MWHCPMDATTGTKTTTARMRWITIMTTKRGMGMGQITRGEYSPSCKCHYHSYLLCVTSPVPSTSMMHENTSPMSTMATRTIHGYKDHNQEDEPPSGSSQPSGPTQMASSKNLSVSIPNPQFPTPMVSSSA